MGIERAATRWYLQRIAYESEVASIKAKFNVEQNPLQKLEKEERAEIEKQLEEIYIKLHQLGPCPKAMMG